MEKKYGIIYADPPWKYDMKVGTGIAETHYQVMSVTDICSLSVDGITDRDCVLFLWATFPQLKEAFYVIEAWGFKYKTVAWVWIKLNKKTPSPFFGLGYWSRSNAEICLLATKGKPKRVSAKVHQLIISPVEGHSKKPDEARERITQLLGDIPRIELFAREKTAGWDVWGNEVESDINLPIRKEGTNE